MGCSHLKVLPGCEGEVGQRLLLRTPALFQVGVADKYPVLHSGVQVQRYVLRVSNSQVHREAARSTNTTEENMTHPVVKDNTISTSSY